MKPRGRSESAIGQTHWKICRTLLKISMMYIFPLLQLKDSIVDSNIDSFSSFSGNLFTLLVFYHEVADISLGVVVGNAVYVKCTGDMTIVFFYSIFHTSTGISCVKKVASFFWEGPFLDYVLFLCVKEFYLQHT